MKLYVAGKFEEAARVRQVHKRLRNAGHEITHDWTNEDPGERTGDELGAFLRDCAIKDYDGVRTADAVLVLNHPHLFGGAAEMGMALALGKPVFLVEPWLRDNIFFHLPRESGMRTFPDLDSALSVLVGTTGC